jgi:hypothetical protein
MLRDLAVAGRIEALHLIGDVTYGEDACQIRTSSGPQVMATLRNLTIAILKPGGPSNIAVATRRYARDATRILANPRTHRHEQKRHHAAMLGRWPPGRADAACRQLVLQFEKGQPGK